MSQHSSIKSAAKDLLRRVPKRLAPVLLAAGLAFGTVPSSKAQETPRQDNAVLDCSDQSNQSIGTQLGRAAGRFLVDQLFPSEGLGWFLREAFKSLAYPTTPNERLACGLANEALRRGAPTPQ